MSLPSHGVCYRATLSSQPLARSVPDSLVHDLSATHASEFQSLLGAGADSDAVFAAALWMVVHVNAAVPTSSMTALLCWSPTCGLLPNLASSTSPIEAMLLVLPSLVAPSRRLSRCAFGGLIARRACAWTGAAIPIRWVIVVCEFIFRATGCKSRLILHLLFIFCIFCVVTFHRHTAARLRTTLSPGLDGPTPPKSSPHKK